jgi:hypothetical protein
MQLSDIKGIFAIPFVSKISRFWDNLLNVRLELHRNDIERIQTKCNSIDPKLPNLIEAALISDIYGLNLFVRCLFNEHSVARAINTGPFIASYVSMINEYELERMWRETA